MHQGWEAKGQLQSIIPSFRGKENCRDSGMLEVMEELHLEQVDYIIHFIQSWPVPL
jgi:hypothetical protein